jgi:hypothetical protein
VNLEYGGKVTSHLVKYSHHASGEALFTERQNNHRDQTPIHRSLPHWREKVSYMEPDNPDYQKKMLEMVNSFDDQAPGVTLTTSMT